MSWVSNEMDKKLVNYLRMREKKGWNNERKWDTVGYKKINRKKYQEKNQIPLRKEKKEHNIYKGRRL